MTNIVTRAGSMKKKKKTAILYKTTSKLEKKRRKQSRHKNSHTAEGTEKKETR
jgi:hypothetical protein